MIGRNACSQSEIYDFIDPAFMLNPELIAEEINMTDSLDQTPIIDNNSVSARLKLLEILSWKYDSEQADNVFQQRLYANSPHFKLSQLSKSKYSSAGIEIGAIPGRLQLYFGDIQFDHGLGLVFSSRRRFSSWTAAPDQQIYRARGISARSSSDSLRILRGAAASLFYKKGICQFFFTDDKEGISLNYKSDKLILGYGLFSIKEQDDLILRHGSYFKYRTRDGIVFGEVALQNLGARALEFGYCFFRNSSQCFVINYSYLIKGFNPLFSKVLSSNIMESDKQGVMLNYRWEIRRSLILHTDIKADFKQGMIKTGFLPSQKWRSRLGLQYDYRDGSCFLLRFSAQHEEISILLRNRLWISPMSGYIQYEAGWSNRRIQGKDSLENFYLGLDCYTRCLSNRFMVNAGVSIHRGEEGSILFYRYEPDLYYQMSMPVLSGSGIRVYLKCKYALKENLKIEIKLTRALKYPIETRLPQNTIKVQLIFSPWIDVQSF